MVCYTRAHTRRAERCAPCRWLGAAAGAPRACVRALSASPSRAAYVPLFCACAHSAMALLKAPPGASHEGAEGAFAPGLLEEAADGEPCNPPRRPLLRLLLCTPSSRHTYWQNSSASSTPLQGREEGGKKKKRKKEG
jgi:hypothetical protein